MVMLRGVLVVFTYMVTLIPNESFEVNGLMILFVVIILFIIRYIIIYNVDFSLVTVNLWITFFSILSLFLVGFLLVIILLVVSLRYINDGAFRIG